MKNNTIFSLTVEDLQNESLTRIGRILTDDEIDIARKGIDWGITDMALNITYNTIFTEMIK